jgi:hypothetical protein
LIFSILREITIGDSFFEFCCDFYTFFFTKESELFAKFRDSFAGEEDFLVSHRK